MTDLKKDYPEIAAAVLTTDEQSRAVAAILLREFSAEAALRYAEKIGRNDCEMGGIYRDAAAIIRASIIGRAHSHDPDSYGRCRSCGESLI